MKQKLFRGFLGIGLICWFVLSFSTGQAQTAATVSLPSLSVPEGLNIGVKMSISGIPGAGLSDFQGALSFDPNVVQVSRVTGLNGYTVFASQLDNQSGEARFVVAKTNTPFLQQGDVLEFSFTPVASVGSSTTMAARMTTFNDSNGVFIPHEMSAGRLTIVQREPLVSSFSFTPQPVIKGQPVQFTNTTVPSQGAAIENTSWNFGDGNTSVEQNPTHTFAQPGVFTVELNVTDNFGRNNATTQQVNVLESAPTTEGVVESRTFPQPASTQVTFVYQVPNSAQRVMLFVFASTGKQVFANNALDARGGRFTWGLVGNDENRVSNGAYFYVLTALGEAGNSVGRTTGKIIVQR